MDSKLRASDELDVEFVSSNRRYSLLFSGAVVLVDASDAAVALAASIASSMHPVSPASQPASSMI